MASAALPSNDRKPRLESIARHKAPEIIWTITTGSPGEALVTGTNNDLVLVLGHVLVLVIVMTFAEIAFAEKIAFAETALGNRHTCRTEMNAFPENGVRLHPTGIIDTPVGLVVHPSHTGIILLLTDVRTEITIRTTRVKNAFRVTTDMLTRHVVTLPETAVTKPKLSNGLISEENHPRIMAKSRKKIRLKRISMRIPRPTRHLPNKKILGML